MSAVFMCDSCGELFSANERGWRQFTETHNGDPGTRDVYNNPHNHGAMTKHVGPCCNLTDGQIKPRLALSPTKKD